MTDFRDQKIIFAGEESNQLHAISIVQLMGKRRKLHFDFLPLVFQLLIF